MGSLSCGGLFAVGSCQQGVEAIVRAGVVSFVAYVTVVDAGAGKRSLVHEHGAIPGVISGLTLYRILRETEKTDSVTELKDGNEEKCEQIFKRSSNFSADQSFLSKNECWWWCAAEKLMLRWPDRVCFCSLRDCYLE